MSDVGGVDCDVDGGVSDFPFSSRRNTVEILAIKYAITPKTPVNIMRKIKITRKIVNEDAMYSAGPPAEKPETFLFVVLLYKPVSWVNYIIYHCTAQQRKAAVQFWTPSPLELSDRCTRNFLLDDCREIATVVENFRMTKFVND